MRTRIKICGNTTVEDVSKAIALGVDAIGLIFAPQSPRYLSLAQAQMILDSIPALVTSVGVFVNPTYEELQKILQTLPLDLLQFHGDETSEFCASFAKPYIKAIRMREGVDLHQLCTIYSSAKALLLDTFTVDKQGGSGIAFDWSLIPKNLSKPIILAGGLTPENVEAAITAVHPYAVDVASGVEVEKNTNQCIRKDHAKLTEFVKRVNNANRK